MFEWPCAQLEEKTSRADSFLCRATSVCNKCKGFYYRGTIEILYIYPAHIHFPFVSFPPQYDSRVAKFG